jgi:Leucine-rich repeat (LRR) protein
LELIRLELNFLTGPLPTELGLLDNLFGLEVQYNELSGIIPDEIYDLTLMTIINVAKNKNIGGTMSSRIGQLTFLTAFYTSGNIIKGSIPSQIGNLLDLGTYFSFFMHRLFVAVKQILTQAYIHFLFCTERVWMFDNKLTGTIPTEIGNLVNLVEFNIGFNSFTGSIPTFVGQLENLGELMLCYYF